MAVYVFIVEKVVQHVFLFLFFYQQREAIYINEVCGAIDEFLVNIVIDNKDKKI